MSKALTAARLAVSNGIRYFPLLRNLISRE